MDALQTPDVERLLQLLEEQRTHYQRLRDLGHEQRKLISGDRPELLLNILRDRQQLVTELARLNEALAPYRRAWDAIYPQLPEPQRQRSQALLAEINGLLALILQCDQEDTALLSARRSAVAAAMSDLSGGRTANAAYAAPAPAAAGGFTA
jgi:hypothetical protein